MISLQESVQNVIRIIMNSDNEEIFSFFLKFCEESLTLKLYKISNKDLITKVISNCNNDNIDDALKRIMKLRKEYPNDYAYISTTKKIVYQEKSNIIDLINNNIDKLTLYLIVNERIARPFWKFYFKSVIEVFESDSIGMYESCYFKATESADIFNMIEKCLDNVVIYNETDIAFTYNFNNNLAVSLIMGNIEKYAKFWYSFAMFYVHDVN